VFLSAPKSRRWRRVAFLVLVAAAALFAWERWGARRFQHGGSWLGIVLGSAALALVVWLLLFAVRKRAYASTLGSLEGWLQAHVWLGVASAGLVLLHTGFRFEDRVAVAAFLVLLAVVATGIVGAYLYQVLPRRLTAIESNLTAAEISADLNRMAASMARLASGRSAAFRGIHAALVAESAPPPLAGWRQLFTAPRAAGEGGATRSWEALLGRVEEAERDELRRLLVLARQHKELHLRLAVQQRYRNLLDAWLYLHVPLSLALVVLVAAHLVAAFYWGL
jgi:hypothetical protein